METPVVGESSELQQLVSSDGDENEDAHGNSRITNDKILSPVRSVKVTLTISSIYKTANKIFNSGFVVGKSRQFQFSRTKIALHQREKKQQGVDFIR